MNENNISLREVDESLRQDRISALVKKYRFVFIGIVSAVILAVVAQEVIRARQESAARERFLQVEGFLRSNDVQEQAKALEFMNESAQIARIDDYAKLRNHTGGMQNPQNTDFLLIESQLLQADSELEAGNSQGALEIYQEILTSQSQLGGLYSVIEALYLSSGGELANLVPAENEALDDSASNSASTDEEGGNE